MQRLQEKKKALEEYYQAKKKEQDLLLNQVGQKNEIQNITKFVSGIGQAGMAIQQIQNLGSIWKNSDLSGGEKLLQTVTNLAMSLPMLGKGLNDIVNGIKSIGPALGGFSVGVGALITVTTLLIDRYNTLKQKHIE